MAIYDNNNRVALWVKESAAGLTYLSGTVNIDGVDKIISLFYEEADEAKPNKPYMKGKIEDKKSK